MPFSPCAYFSIFLLLLFRTYISRDPCPQSILHPYLKDVTLVQHGVGDLDETGDVGALDNGWQRVLVLLAGVLLRGLDTVVEAVDHDVLELPVDVVPGPARALRVLRHLETGASDTTTVGGLTDSVPHGLGWGLGELTSGLEGVEGLWGAAHVGALGDKLGARGDETLGLVTGDLVLRGTWQGDVDLAGVEPWARAVDVLDLVLGEGRVLLDDLGQGLELDLGLGDGSDVFGGDSVLGDDTAAGVGKGDNDGTQLDSLQGGELGDVTGTGDDDTLPGEGLAAVGGVVNHGLGEVDTAVTGGLWSDEGTTPVEALTGQDTLPGVVVCSVRTEQVADLTATDTDITGGDVCVGADVVGQLAHEREANTADLGVGLGLEVDTETTLGTTHVQTGQGVLEDLLETQEFQDGEVDTWVETQTALVWALGGVVLDSVTWGYLLDTVVVLPGNTELDNTLWNRDDWQHLAVLWLLLEEGGLLEGRNDFVVSLLEFWFSHCKRDMCVCGWGSERLES